MKKNNRKKRKSEPIGNGRGRKRLASPSSSSIKQGKKRRQDPIFKELDSTNVIQNEIVSPIPPPPISMDPLPPPTVTKVSMSTQCSDVENMMEFIPFNVSQIESLFAFKKNDSNDSNDLMEDPMKQDDIFPSDWSKTFLTNPLQSSKKVNIRHTRSKSC